MRKPRIEIRVLCVLQKVQMYIYFLFSFFIRTINNLPHAQYKCFKKGREKTDILLKLWLIKTAGEKLINESLVNYDTCPNKFERKYSCSRNCFLTQRKKIK